MKPAPSLAAGPQAAAAPAYSGRALVALGRGKQGKTSLLRTTSEMALAAGRQVIVCDADPVNRTLADTMRGRSVPVLQPTANTDQARADFLRQTLEKCLRAGARCVIDLGGNDRTALHVAGQEPSREALEALQRSWGLAGVHDPLEDMPVTVAMLLGGDIDDLPLLGMVLSSFLCRRQMLLVLNDGVLRHTPGIDQDRWDHIRRHPIYEAAVRAGAKELILPRMEYNLASRLCRAPVSFVAAARGADVEGAPLTTFERRDLNLFLAETAMAIEKAGVSELLP